jgi:hypothetical protein
MTALNIYKRRMTMRTEIRPLTHRQAQRSGWVELCSWGGWIGQGSIYARPSDRPAAQAALGDIRLGDDGPDVLDGVVAAGGIFVADSEDD